MNHCAQVGHFFEKHIFLRNFTYITSKMVTNYSENNICVFNIIVIVFSAIGVVYCYLYDV